MAEYEFTVIFGKDKSGGGSKDKKKSGAGKQEKSAAPSSTLKSSVGDAELEAPTGGAASSVDDMFDLAREWVGHPYLSPSLVMKFGESTASQMVAKRSSSSKRAIDCSGFAQEVLGYAGIDPPGDQTAEGLYKYFKTNGTTLKSPQKGALVFFEEIKPADEDSGTWDAGRSVTHVAFSTGGNKIMDSSGGRGVTERSMPAGNRFKYHYIMPKYKFGSGGNT